MNLDLILPVVTNEIARKSLLIIKLIRAHGASSNCVKYGMILKIPIQDDIVSFSKMCEY